MIYDTQTCDNCPLIEGQDCHKKHNWYELCKADQDHAAHWASSTECIISASKIQPVYGKLPQIPPQPMWLPFIPDNTENEMV